jgi:glycine hydroxymethyltransferase
VRSTPRRLNATLPHVHAGPALTTRGLGADEMDRIAELMCTVLARATPTGNSKAKYDPAIASQVSEQANELLADFPLYREIDLGS